MNGSNEPITITTTPEQAVEFLQKLARDDEFRERYRENARGLLELYGVHLPSDLPPELREPPSPEVLDPILAALERDSLSSSFLVFLSFLGVASFRGL